MANKKANHPPKDQAPDGAPEESVLPEVETPESENPGTETPEGEINVEDLSALMDEPFSASSKLEAENAELKDQLLRALAETENVRRRADRDRQEAAKYAVAPLARDLLAVADNLARAIESLRQEAAGDDKLASLLAGVELTQKELLNAFDRHNIAMVDPIGERLDPHRHEAMYEVPHETAASGTVVQVVQPGYLLHDRLLRPARVGVAKAVAGPPPEESSDPSEEPPLKSSA